MVDPDTTAGRASPRSSSALDADERAVVARFAGGFGWPTIVLAMVLLAVQVGVIALWARGTVPLAVGFVVNALVAYAWYTVHHEATHKAISGRNPRLQRAEVACGTMAGFFLGLEFRSYSGNHLRHHAHTNTESDPDLFVKGPLAQVPVKWAVLSTLANVGALPWGDRLVRSILARAGIPSPMGSSDRDRSDRNRGRRFGQLRLLIVLASIPLGWFVPVFFLWWLPGWFGILLLMVLFQWLPHFPFDRTDRFGATRINRFPGSMWVLLQQDRHLIHHLYPQVPWFRYRAVHRELAVLLDEREARIEGSGTHPPVPIQLRQRA
jgi:fatty acid desaturase